MLTHGHFSGGGGVHITTDIITAEGIIVVADIITMGINADLG